MMSRRRAALEGIFAFFFVVSLWSGGGCSLQESGGTGHWRMRVQKPHHDRRSGDETDMQVKHRGVGEASGGVAGVEWATRRRCETQSEGGGYGAQSP